MEKYYYKRVVIKAGTHTVTYSGHEIDRDLIDDLAYQGSKFIEAGGNLSIVSSGAVATGKLALGRWSDGIVERQVLAGVGQWRLSESYGNAFAAYDLHIAQFLLTRRDLRKPNLPLLLALEHSIIPIINNNDATTIEGVKELDGFKDNDVLAGLVAKKVNADLLIILTDVADGVLDKQGQTIRQIRPNQRVGLLSQPGTESGTGSMSTKIRVARKTARSGINTVIVGGKIHGVLDRILAQDQIGTWILGSEGLKTSTILARFQYALL